MMTPILWRIVIAFVVFGGGFTAGMAISRNHYTARIATMEKERAQQNQAIAETITKEVQDNESLTQRLEVEHGKANIVIDTVADQPIPRVRIKYLPAADCVQAQAASGVPSTEQSAGVLLEKAGAIMDAGRSRVKGIIIEAERELASCRPSKEWAAKQNH